MKKAVLIIIVILVIVGVCFGAVTLFKKDDGGNQVTGGKYGTVEKETVDTLVAKFNKKIMDTGSSNYASNDTLSIKDHNYWYTMLDGVHLIVVPVEVKNDEMLEVVDSMTIQVEKSSSYQSQVNTYLKYLIKANNEEITDEEIENLINDSKSGQSANCGKGISVKYAEDDSKYEYQVLRIYK